MPKIVRKWVSDRVWFLDFSGGSVPAGFFLLFLSAILSPANAQDALKVSATLSTDTVGALEQFQLTVTVTGSESGQAQTPKLPPLRGLRVVSGPNLSTQFQWINGQSAGSKSFIYILLPEKEGQFTIDPIEVTVGNRILQTEPLSIRVTSASSTPAPSSRAVPTDPFGEDIFGGTRRGMPGSDEVFVSAELDRTSAYSGEQVTLTYHLYTRVSVTGLQLQDNPPLNGFWVENIEVESKPVASRRVINGRDYQDYVIKKQALFPNMPGRLKIPSSTFAISVKTSGDIFGFFGQTETVYRKTTEASLDVRPLPEENRPVDFNNAVGSFTLSSEADKTSVATGDAVSLWVKLAGKGNLKAIPGLPLPAVPDLTVYSSKSEESIHAVDGDLMGGEKVWEYVVVPKVPGNHSIPAFSFSFFNPQRETYETVTTRSILLSVEPGGDSAGDIGGFPGINRQNLIRQGTDINFIKLSHADLEAAGEAPYTSVWFYLIAAVPLAGNIGILWVRRERARQSQNVVQARSRRAKRLALSRLRKAEKAGRLQPRRFYDDAAYAFAGYLEDRFNLPDIALTSDALERTMEEQNIAPETVKGTVAVLQECDFGRFVSASQTPERRSEMLQRIRSVIDSLEQSRR